MLTAYPDHKMIKKWALGELTFFFTRFSRGKNVGEEGAALPRSLRAIELAYRWEETESLRGPGFSSK